MFVDYFIRLHHIFAALILIIAMAAVVCLTPIPRTLIGDKYSAVLKPVDIVSDSEMYKPKPIPLEMMNNQEKENLNISTTNGDRIQVLQRNADGSISVYRIINSDADIVTEY